MTDDATRTISSAEMAGACQRKGLVSSDSSKSLNVHFDTYDTILCSQSQTEEYKNKQVHQAITSEVDVAVTVSRLIHPRPHSEAASVRALASSRDPSHETRRENQVESRSIDRLMFDKIIRGQGKQGVNTSNSEPPVRVRPVR